MGSMSNYPNGFEHGVTIRGVPILNTYNGNVYYVDSVNGSNAYNGTYIYPKASIDYLFLNDIVKAGDIIIAKPGHVETIATVSTWDIAGVCVIFDGQGTSKPYFNITAVDAYVNITGAGISLINPKFLTGIDAVAKGLQIAAADVGIYNTEYHDAPAMASTIQFLTTTAAHRLCIKGYRYYASTTGTQKTDGIKTTGSLAAVTLQDIQIVGDFSAAPIDISAALVNVNMDNLNLNNTNTDPQPAMVIHANTTGFAENVKCRIDSGTTYVSSTAKIQWGAMCQGYNTDGSGGAAIGSATDITAAVDSVGVNTSTIISKTHSVGLQASNIQDSVASVATQVSSADSRAAVAVTGVNSVGVQTSAAQSMVLSTATAVSSRITSVGVTASEVTSQATSIGIATSAIHANTVSIMTSVASQATSVGTGTSVTHAQVQSLATSVASQALSVGIGASQAYANTVSIMTSTASQALSVALGASQAYANTISIMTSTASQATSVGTGTSVCNANTISTSNSVTSVGTSLGIGVSTTVNYSNQAVSILNSLALIISTINSKT